MSLVLRLRKSIILIIGPLANLFCIRFSAVLVVFIGSTDQSL